MLPLNCPSQDSHTWYNSNGNQSNTTIPPDSVHTHCLKVFAYTLRHSRHNPGTSSIRKPRPFRCCISLDVFCRRRPVRYVKDDIWFLGCLPPCCLENGYGCSRRCAGGRLHALRRYEIFPSDLFCMTPLQNCSKTKRRKQIS